MSGRWQTILKAHRWRLAWVALSVAVLTPGYYKNAYNVVPKELFLFHQTDGESLVLGRLVESRSHGLFTYGGLLGRTNPQLAGSNTMKDVFAQYIELIEGGKTKGYKPYESHPGGQALVLYGLYRLGGYDGAWLLRVGKLINSLLYALVLGLIVAWLHREAGWTAAGMLLAWLVVLRWPTLFARNLFWCMWAFYLPMLVLYGWLARRDGESRRELLWLGGVTAAAVYVKIWFTGYEYITTALVMTVMPVAYLWLRRGHDRRWLVRIGGAACVGCGVAVVVGLMQLALQITVCEGSVAAGVHHVVEAFEKRTRVDPSIVPPEFAKSLTTSQWEVLRRYLNMGAADLSRWFTWAPWVTFIQLIGAIGVATLVGWGLVKAGRWPQERRTVFVALAGTTWLSILAPLSWFIIFKGHSADHYHMNAITWHMPFLLLGAGLVGMVVEGTGRAAWELVRGGKREGQFVSLSVCQFVSLSVCQFVSLSVCQFGSCRSGGGETAGARTGVKEVHVRRRALPGGYSRRGAASGESAGRAASHIGCRY